MQMSALCTTILSSFLTFRRSLRFAQQLQAEEDEQARRYYAEHERRAQEERRTDQNQSPQQGSYPQRIPANQFNQTSPGIQKHKKKKGDCIVM